MATAFTEVYGISAKPTPKQRHDTDVVRLALKKSSEHVRLMRTGAKSFEDAILSAESNLERDIATPSVGRDPSGTKLVDKMKNMGTYSPNYLKHIL
jgi:hypothetical protein